MSLDLLPRAVNGVVAGSEGAVPSKRALVPEGRIERAILLIRGEKVILDADLAALYGVTAKRLNEQVKRNRSRFPEDFMFQLTWEETRSLRLQIATLDGSGTEGSRSQFVTLNGSGRDGLRSQIATLDRGKHLKYRPYAFTEHGAIMAANVLNSDRAVKVGVYVVRTFVKLRQMLTAHKELARRLDDLERKVDGHDHEILALVEAIRELMAPPPEPKRRRIGFHPE